MAFLETQALLTMFFLYLLASGLYIDHVVRPASRLAYYGRLATIAGLAANLLALLARTFVAGRLPLANMYEFGIFMLACLVALFLFTDNRRSINGLGAVVLPLAFVLSALFLSFYQQSKPLVPALKSNWLLAHVLTAVIAYGALALSFSAAVLYRWRHYRAGTVSVDEPGTPAQLRALEELINRAITFAMPMLTLLIITGAVWAEYAWGSYWRWDPKETWSLITWLIYAAYLHGRLSLGWRGPRAANWAIGGFLAVVFTFVGVNLLLPGLHSYAR